MKKLKFIFEVFKKTAKQWNDADVFKDSTSLAYYALFSIPSLLIILIWVVGHFLGTDVIQGEISTQISGAMGEDVAKSIEGLIVTAMIDEDNIFMKTVGIGGLVFGATTLFFQLQKSLNALWGVETVPERALKGFLLARANSLGMIVVIGFLLVIAMVLSSVISLANDLITQHFGLQTYLLMRLVNELVGFLTVVVTFALMFKILPDVTISWRSIWAGSFVTAILFIVGRFLLSLYFGQFKPTSAFGAAGTVILMMMWINYSCLLIFFGAGFTKIYARARGHRIEPANHAKWIQEECQI